MKVAVSIPDSIFDEVENLAAQLKTSRSGLYARALGEFIDRHAPDKLTQAMNDAVAVIDEVPDPFFKTAARRILDKLEW